MIIQIRTQFGQAVLKEESNHVDCMNAWFNDEENVVSIIFLIREISRVHVISVVLCLIFYKHYIENPLNASRLQFNRNMAAIVI